MVTGYITLESCAVVLGLLLTKGEGESKDTKLE